MKTVLEVPNFVSKLVALGSDGASVMLGKNAGVFALLKKQPSLIVVHCSAHRLDCATKMPSRKYLLLKRSSHC